MPATPTKTRAAKPAAATADNGKPKKDKDKTDVPYPELKAIIRAKSAGNPLTFKEAGELLKWTEDTPEFKFTDWVEEIELESGRRVKLLNNMKNRIIKKWQLETLEQEHLNGRFVLTPDALGIGRSGQIMSAQHRLISFRLAEIKRRSNTEEGEFWRKRWPEELTMDCLILYGLDESDETFRALNSSAPATVADCLYRAGYFKGQKGSTRANLCKIAEGAIKLIHDRTGEFLSRENSLLTIPGAMEWFGRHPKLEDFVVHIHEEYQSNNKGRGEITPELQSKIDAGEAACRYAHQQRLTASTATALLWFMAASQTDRDKYLKSKRTDRAIDWTWEAKAYDFWTCLCSGNGEFEVVKGMLDTLSDPKLEINPVLEKKGLVIKAWNLFKLDSKITADAIRMERVSGKLVEWPKCHGLDIGEEDGVPSDPVGDRDGLGEDDAEAIEQAKAQAQEAKISVSDDVKDAEEEAAKKIVMDVKKAHPGKILLWENAHGEYVAWEADSEIVGRILRLTPKRFPNGWMYVGFRKGDLTGNMTKFRLAKKQVLICKEKDGKVVTEEPAK